MINELITTTKQIGFDLIDMSQAVADRLETWGDVLEKNPDSITATVTAGFVTKPTDTSDIEMVIDVQAPPTGGAILRTWAIELIEDTDSQTLHSNDISLTFDADRTAVESLIQKGKGITRDDIRQLLADDATKLASILISKDAVSDGTQKIGGDKYDYAVDELEKLSDENLIEIQNAIDTVLQTLKKSAASISSSAQ